MADAIKNYMKYLYFGFRLVLRLTIGKHDRQVRNVVPILVGIAENIVGGVLESLPRKRAAAVVRHVGNGGQRLLGVQIIGQIEK